MFAARGGFFSQTAFLPGELWTERATAGANTLNDVAWNGSRFVAVGLAGTIRTSLDGVTTIDGVAWPATTAGSQGFNSVAWSPEHNVWIAVGNNGTIYRGLANAATWSARTSNTSNDLQAVTWAGNRFVVVGSNGTVLTSTDGLSWTTRTSGTTQTLIGINWRSNGGSTALVAVGSNGTILTSSAEGTSWTSRTSGLTNVLLGVGNDGNQWVVVGSPVILTSPDGVTWTERTSGTTQTLRDVVWSGAEFITVGDQGTIRASSDGINWSTRNSGTTEPLNGIAWSDTRFAAVGTAIFTS